MLLGWLLVVGLSVWMAGSTRGKLQLITRMTTYAAGFGYLVGTRRNQDLFGYLVDTRSTLDMLSCRPYHPPPLSSPQST